MKMTIGAFVLAQLKALSIRTVFGVPGDYNLELLEFIEHDDQIDFVGSCNELMQDMQRTDTPAFTAFPRWWPRMASAIWRYCRRLPGRMRNRCRLFY